MSVRKTLKSYSLATLPLLSVNEFIPELTGSSNRPTPRPFENSILNDHRVSKQKMN